VTGGLLRTGRPARVDGFEGQPGSPEDELNALGYGGAAAAPIFVEGRLWGVLRVAWSKERSVSLGSQARLLQFSELIAAALANADARDELRRVAEEQSALRRVATLVARGEPPSAVFAAVATETGRVIPAAGVALVGRYDLDEESIEFVGGWSPAGEPSFVGNRVTLGGDNVATLVFRGNQPARVDRIPSDNSTPATVLARNWARSSAGAPIDVQGRLWGVLTVGAEHEDELPIGTEYRLAQFTELVASAISNSQARGDLGRVADEQAALRRVATLVAEAASPSAIFASVTEEVGRLLGVEVSAMWRFLADGAGEIVAQWTQTGEGLPVGLRVEHIRGSLTAIVRETRRPARVDQYDDDSGRVAHAIGIRSSVGVPITVEGEPWGLIAIVSMGEEPPPPGTEDRLAGFTELVATAIANAQAREELRAIADEQAALGRVATLVAQGETPEAVFAAVAEQIGHLLSTDDAMVVRFEPDESVTIVASWSATGEPIPVGHRRQVEPGDGLTPRIRKTGRPARIDSQTSYYSELGVESAVAAPITVEGRIWGVVGVALRGPNPAPPHTEERLTAFTDIVATAIANAESRSQVLVSRARIVAAADTARRRIERDLHDGAQQRLVSLGLELRKVQAAMPPGLAARLETFAVGLNDALEELVELARGIHPPILTQGGLPPALRTLARRCAVPVEVALRMAGRLPEQIEIAAYYVVSEALTNATKHAHATAVTVNVDAEDYVLRIEVRDDGVGGATFTSGTGLVGLKDRVESLNGQILLDSTPGTGTSLRVELPIPATLDTTITSS